MHACIFAFSHTQLGSTYSLKCAQSHMYVQLAINNTRVKNRQGVVTYTNYTANDSSKTFSKHFVICGALAVFW